MVGDGVELGFALMFVLLLVGIVAFMVGSVRVAQAAAACAVHSYFSREEYGFSWP